jgi:hypothetical protein
MPRKYAVLKQFAQDFDRLLRESETAFAALRNTTTPTQAEILAVYRPIHSLKGICGMVDETKLLVRAFHALEDLLPPLLPLQIVKSRSKSVEKTGWIAVADGTLKMAREVERILVAKIDLWQKLGADENDSRGLVISFTDSGVTERVWVVITNLIGLVDATEVTNSASGLTAVIGRTENGSGEANEALLIDSVNGPVAVYFDEIETTCTRLDAVQAGVPRSFKEWWAAASKSRGIAAA